LFRLSDHLVVADSDEHTEDGHLTEDLIVRKRMVEKRGRKLKILREAAVPPEFKGEPHPDLLLVTWGSGQGAVWEAAAFTGPAHASSQLYFPGLALVPDHFLPIFRKPGNHRRRDECCRAVQPPAPAGDRASIEKTILRYDGLPLPNISLRKWSERGW
jgi:2-oxoglutarate ferredoxin oxidoreductase subunit alpha